MYKCVMCYVILRLYQCLSIVAMFISSTVTICIRNIEAAKIYLLILRHSAITLTAFAFAAYGTGVLTDGTQNIVDNTDACDNAIIPYRFNDLVLSSDILAWIIG